MDFMKWKENLLTADDKTRRKLALEWWNSISPDIKEHYAKRYFNRHHNNLTGREIQMIHEGDKPDNHDSKP